MMGRMSDVTGGDTPVRAISGRPNRRAEGKARTREAVLTAAATVFAGKGYGSASVEEIAREAGVAIGSVYAHFGGKRALFAALIERTTADAPVPATGVPAGDDVRGVLDRLGSRLAGTADDRVRALLGAETWLYAVRYDDDLSAAVTEDDRRTRAALAAAVGSDLTGSDLVRADHTGSDLTAGELATVLNALFHGMARQRRLDPGSVPDGLFARAAALLAAAGRDPRAGRG